METLVPLSLVRAPAVGRHVIEQQQVAFLLKTTLFWSMSLFNLVASARKF
jgi:hypothetical protein